MTGIYDHAARAQNRRMALLAAASLTTWLPAAALAQAEDAAPAADAAGDDGAIIVTARRRHESILETPIAVSVASGEELRRNDVALAPDLVNLPPSLTAQKVDSAIGQASWCGREGTTVVYSVGDDALKKNTAATNTKEKN